MTTLAAYGLEVLLPPGFEGRIFRRAPKQGSVTRPVAHFATFPLPAYVGDFGGGAVNLMGPDDLFAVLFEYGPESVGKALFARQGIVRRLAPEHFRPDTLRRGLGGQAGTQWFFVEAGRPFTFYAVVGSRARRLSSVPRLNQLLQGTSIRPGDWATR